MLRKIRIALAILFFVLITLLFLDFTGTIHAWFGWMAKIQFLPAVLALNVGVVVGLILLTLLFGRVYCSVICPLGVMQDLALAGRAEKSCSGIFLSLSANGNTQKNMAQKQKMCLHFSADRAIITLAVKK